MGSLGRLNSVVLWLCCRFEDFKRRFAPNSAPDSPLQIRFRFSPSDKPFSAAGHPAPAGVLYSENYYLDGEVVRPVNQKMERVGYSIISA